MGEECVSGEGACVGEECVSGEGAYVGEECVSGEGACVGEECVSGEGACVGEVCVSGEGAYCVREVQAHQWVLNRMCMMGCIDHNNLSNVLDGDSHQVWGDDGYWLKGDGPVGAECEAETGANID